MKQFTRIVLLCSLLGCAVQSWAATTTTSFAVTATVVPTCAVSAAALNFGGAIPNPINSNVDGTGSVTATCSTGAPYTIALSVGSGAGATFASRKLTSGPNSLNYSLYTDAGCSTVWGDSTAGSSLLNGSGSGVAQIIPVYGRIPTGQTVATGAYSDTIIVTLNF